MQELSEKYKICSLVDSVTRCLRNAETGMILLNLGGQDREEWPDEYAIIYKNTASTFNVYKRLKGQDNKIREKHILNILLAEEVKVEEAFLKECIVEALTVNNDASNVRFLKRNPQSKPYSIEFVFEEKK